MRRVEAVVFDLGETLVNETRAWTGWAEWLGVPSSVLFAALGAVIAQRQHHLRAFELIRPGFDFAAERGAREAAGQRWTFDSTDLYPDALRCLDQLRAEGYRIGVVGNQPAGIESTLPDLTERAEFVASSGSWRVEKPDPAFFERVAGELDLPLSSVAYVGDRLDNDVLPAVASGMCGVFVRRGPWGVIHASWPEADRATITIDSLDELTGALR